MPTIATRFHGALAITDRDVIHLEQEILGFSAYRDFVLIPHREESPFLYLQSVAEPGIAFVVMDPLLVMPDYVLPVAELPDALLGDPRLWAVLGVCTITGANQGTINLKSPVIINRETRRGGQFVLSLPYSFDHPLFQEAAHARTEPANQ